MKFWVPFLEDHASHPVIQMHWMERMTLPLYLCHAPSYTTLASHGDVLSCGRCFLEVTAGLSMAELSWTCILVLSSWLDHSIAIIAGTSCTWPGTRNKWWRLIEWAKSRTLQPSPPSLWVGVCWVMPESVFDASLQKWVPLNTILNLQCRHSYCFWKRLCKTSQLAILI